MGIKITVEKNIGENLRTLLSQTLGKNVYEVFKEFVSNSYDADAEKVSITVNTLDDLLVIEDDGIGMDEIGIQNFYRMGDSEKIDNPLTAKGRQKIGKFGIATVLLEYLADSYVLETWKNSKKITIEDNFKLNTNSDKIPYTVIVNDKLNHGTKLTLHDLSFINDEKFSLNRLKKVLSWEMPLRKDFSIKINGEQLYKEKIYPTREYYLDSNLPNVGDVTGKLYYFRNGSPNAGIFIYVNGRVVGDPHYFDIAKVSRALPNKILGLIQADGLSEYISFDRSRFQEDHPAFAEVVQTVYKHLYNIKNDILDIYQDEMTQSAKINISKAVKEVTEKLKKVSLERLEKIKERENRWTFNNQLQTSEMDYKFDEQEPLEIQGSIIDEQYDKQDTIENGMERNGKLEFLLIDRSSSKDMASCSQDKKTIYINAGHPLFHLLRTETQGAYLSSQFLYAASWALGSRLTKDQLGNNRYAEKLLTQRENRLSGLSKQIFGLETNLVSLLKSSLVVADKHTKLNPCRVYKENEIIEGVDISVITMRKLITSRALKSRTNNNLFLGEDVISILNQFDGYTPAYLLVREFFQAGGENMHRQQLNQLMNKIELNLDAYAKQIDYVKNIGDTQPFYFVEKDQSQKFLTLYSQGLLRLKSVNTNILPPDLAKRDGVKEASYVTLYQASKELDITRNELFNMFDQSKLIGKTIESTKINGVEVYNLHDVKSIAMKWTK